LKSNTGAVIRRPMWQNITISHLVSANLKDYAARAPGGHPYDGIDKHGMNCNLFFTILPSDLSNFKKNMSVHKLGLKY